MTHSPKTLCSIGRHGSDPKYWSQALRNTSNSLICFLWATSLTVYLIIFLTQQIFDPLLDYISVAIERLAVTGKFHVACLGRVEDVLQLRSRGRAVEFLLWKPLTVPLYDVLSGTVDSDLERVAER